jgi:hypothetical protein
MQGPDATRRELLRGSVAATAAVLVSTVDPAVALGSTAAAGGGRSAAAAGGGSAGAGGSPAGDLGVLVSLLRVEQVVVFAYERALASGLLSASAQAALGTFLDHERAHVHALSRALTRLGGTVPVAPTLTAAFESELHRLHVKRSPTGLDNERQELRFLIDLERVIARHYRSAIARLGTDKLLTTAAEIMANEAQHATALAELLSPGNVKRAVPTGFVAGVGGG